MTRYHDRFARRFGVPWCATASMLIGLTLLCAQAAHGQGGRNDGRNTRNPYAVRLRAIRSIDGSNSGLRADFGAAHTPLLRHLTAKYPGDGSGDEIIGPPDRPNARTVSNAVAAQVGGVPNDRFLSDYLWAWGQFLDHDIDLTETDPANGTADIEIEDSFDILGPNPIPFTRSNFVVNRLQGSRDQINDITAYIDASNVYGSSTERESALREHRGGRLRTSDGDLLPFNDRGLPNAPAPTGSFFLAGDIRANENVVLTSLHTLFVREHNRLANLIAIHDPDADDEEIYQLARKIVGAEMQLITYQEFLPALLGRHAPHLSEGRTGGQGNAGIANEFSTAFYRIGHSMLSPQLRRWEDGNRLSMLPLRDAFFRPSYLSTDPLNMDRLLSGLQTQRCQEIDTRIVDDVRNFLFGPPGAGGLDLAALNIQRGRDHGLPDYNSLRAAFDLGERTSFASITTDAEIADQLEQLYGTTDNIDCWVGALAEPHVPGTSVGRLMLVGLADQFRRTLVGDRFNVVSDRDLEQPLVNAVAPLASLTLADVVRMNTEKAAVYDKVFTAATPSPTDLIASYDRASNRLFIAGNRMANRVHVYHPSSTVVMLVAFGRSRVNSGRVAVFRTRPNPNVTIDTGLGNDVVNLFFCEFGDVCVSTGAGDDVIRSIASQVQRLFFDDGEGDDRVIPASGIPVANR